MMPPISGMQASAAATFEGKPVDVDFGPTSGVDAGGGGVGSCSGMIYIHRMQNPLSSNLAFPDLFRFRSPAQAQYDAQLTALTMNKSSPPLAKHAFTLMELLTVITIVTKIGRASCRERV